MSLAIDVDKVVRVLLPDGWHGVGALPDGRSSLEFDAFELVEAHDGYPDDIAQPQAESTGISFTDAATGLRVCAPLTALLATAEPTELAGQVLKGQSGRPAPERVT